MNTEPVFLFADPGVDDALAILALHGAGVPIAGICLTTGNVSQQQGAANLSRLFGLVGMETPVYMGSASRDRPARPLSPHGPTGFGLIDTSTPAPRVASEDSLPDLFKAPLTRFACLAPLTDLAWLLRDSASAPPAAAQIIVMGGGELDSTETDFNFQADPEAAAEVLSSGRDLTVVPLAVTRQIALHPEDLQLISRPNSAGFDFLSRLLRPYFEHHERTYGFYGCYIHDPTAVAALLWPELFKFMDVSGTVDSAQGQNQRAVRFSPTPDTFSSTLKLAVYVDESEVKPRLVQCIRAALDNASGHTSA